MTDLFVFAVILAAAEACTFFASTLFPGGATYTFSFMLPITLCVMMRWGWPSVLYASGSGVLYCLFGLMMSVAVPRNFAVYGIGNAFVGLLLIAARLVGKDRIAGKWYHTLWFVVLGWLLVYLGRSTVYAISFAISPAEGSAADGFASFAAVDLLSLVMCIFLVMIMRRFDGMFEDQRSHLKRIEEERQLAMREDGFGSEPVEIDAETLDILNRGNDLYD